MKTLEELKQEESILCDQLRDNRVQQKELVKQAVVNEYGLNVGDEFAFECSRCKIVSVNDKPFRLYSFQKQLKSGEWGSRTHYLWTSDMKDVTKL